MNIIKEHFTLAEKHEKKVSGLIASASEGVRARSGPGQERFTDQRDLCVSKIRGAPQLSDPTE